MILCLPVKFLVNFWVKYGQVLNYGLTVKRSTKGLFNGNTEYIVHSVPKVLIMLVMPSACGFMMI